jgi:hypothetical protein
MGCQPGQALGRAREVRHLETEASPGERSSVGAELLGIARHQLRGDIGDHAVVGGRGRGEHRHPGWQAVQHVLHPPVVRPEVVAPVGDAVRLVDHQQPHRAGEQRHHVVAELSVVKSFRADQQQVGGARGQPIADLGPGLPIRAVDRVGPQAKPLRGRDLVTHQRE